MTAAMPLLATPVWAKTKFTCTPAASRWSGQWDQYAFEFDEAGLPCDTGYCFI